MKLITQFFLEGESPTLRFKKVSFALMSHLLFVGYIFPLRHLQTYYKRGLSIAWERIVPIGNRHGLNCEAATLICSLK